jgi:hypothetical protein
VFTDQRPAGIAISNSFKKKDFKKSSCDAHDRSPAAVVFLGGLLFDPSCPDDYPGQNGGDLGPVEAVERLDSGE